MYVKQSGMGEVDFSKIVGDLVTGYSTVQQAKAARDIAKAQAVQPASFYPPITYAANQPYSPQYTTPAPASNMMPLVLIGGAALLLFFLMKD